MRKGQRSGDGTKILNNSKYVNSATNSENIQKKFFSCDGKICGILLDCTAMKAFKV